MASYFVRNSESLGIGGKRVLELGSGTGEIKPNESLHDLAVIRGLQLGYLVRLSI
jgi:hypothetical protein